MAILTPRDQLHPQHVHACACHVRPTIYIARSCPSSDSSSSLLSLESSYRQCTLVVATVATDKVNTSIDYSFQNEFFLIVELYILVIKGTFNNRV